MKKTVYISNQNDYNVHKYFLERDIGVNCYQDTVLITKNNITFREEDARGRRGGNKDRRGGIKDRRGGKRM